MPDSAAPADVHGALLVIANAPDASCAARIAETLVEQGLAACVNILTPCQSVYRWQGKIERAEEIPLLVKTRRARYAEVEAAIRTLHPYEVPEIIAVPLHAGLPAYLNWIRTETGATPSDPS
jgi:periplasmic divalent cation tolerance protein